MSTMRRQIRMRARKPPLVSNPKPRTRLVTLLVASVQFGCSLLIKWLALSLALAIAKESMRGLARLTGATVTVEPTA